MAIKYLIYKFATCMMGDDCMKDRIKAMLAVFGILCLWSSGIIASIPVAWAQGAVNLAIDSPAATGNYGDAVNFHVNTGLSTADESLAGMKYTWVVRGPRNQWTFMGPSGNLELPPGSYTATVTARDRYGRSAYQDTSSFQVEGAGARPVSRTTDRSDGGRYNDGNYNDGYSDRYDSRYDDRYDNRYNNVDDYYRNGADRYDDGGYNQYNSRYNSPYGDSERYYGDEYTGRYGDNYGRYDNGYGRIGYDDNSGCFGYDNYQDDGRYDNGRYFDVDNGGYGYDNNSYDN